MLTVQKPKDYKKADTGSAPFICIRFEIRGRWGIPGAAVHNIEEVLVFSQYISDCKDFKYSFNAKGHTMRQFITEEFFRDAPCPSVA